METEHILIFALILGTGLIAAIPCLPLQRDPAFGSYRAGVDAIESRVWGSAVLPLTRAVRDLSSSRFCADDNVARRLYEIQSRIFLGLAEDRLGRHAQAVTAWKPLLRPTLDRGLLILANEQLMQHRWNAAFDFYVKELEKNSGGQPGVDSATVNTILAGAISDARAERFTDSSSALASPTLRGVRYADYIGAVVKLREGRRTEARMLLWRVLTDENLMPSPGAPIIYDSVVKASIDLLSRL